MSARRVFEKHLAHLAALVARLDPALTARLDVADHRADAPVFNRSVTLRGAWQQKAI